MRQLLLEQALWVLSHLACISPIYHTSPTKRHVAGRVARHHLVGIIVGVKDEGSQAVLARVFGRRHTLDNGLQDLVNANALWQAACIITSSVQGLPGHAPLLQQHVSGPDRSLGVQTLHL